MEIYNIDDENQIIISKVEKGTLEILKNSINWTQPVVNIFGRTYYPKRQVCTMGKPYKYNGNITDEEIPIIDCVKEIMEEVNTKCNCNFNTCVANYYEDGDAYISMHDDGEQHSENIASVSYGDARSFIVKNKNNDKKYKFQLSDHCMLMMKGNTFQKLWKHGINKEKNKNERVSLTFRKY